MKDYKAESSKKSVDALLGQDTSRQKHPSLPKQSEPFLLDDLEITDLIISQDEWDQISEEIDEEMRSGTYQPPPF